MESNQIIEVQKESLDVAKKADSIIISNNEQRNLALDFLKVIKGMQRKVSETFDPIIEKAHQAHKEAIAQKNKYYTPLLAAEKNIKSKDVEFVMQQERIRREQEEKLRQEAIRKQQELERKAQEAREKGKEVQAEKYEDKAAQIIAPTLSSRTDKIDGISYKTDWDFEVTDALLIPREYLIVDEVKIRRVVKATKGALIIPGTRVFSKQVQSTRI